MATDNGDTSPSGDPESVFIESEIFPGEEFFDPVTGEAATASPLPDPVPITIEIAPPIPEPPVPPERDQEPEPPTLPDRPMGEFVTSADLALALADMIVLTRGMIRDALDVQGIAEIREGLITQEMFQAALGDQAMREQAFREEVVAQAATQAQRSLDLESALATALSEIEDRRLAEIAQVEEDTGFSPLLLFSTLGDLLRDPIGYVLDRSRDQIIEEISIGLNR